MRGSVVSTRAIEMDRSRMGFRREMRDFVV